MPSIPSRVLQLQSMKEPTAKEKEDDLTLFLEMRKREKEKNDLLLQNQEELDQSLVSQSRISPLFSNPPAAPTRKTGTEEVLNSENDKNDYDWNYPLLMAAWKFAPALAAGCAAVLKPSEFASLTCLELGQVCIDVGLQAGVLNILTGLGPDDGAPLACHPEVDKLAFTGSNAIGSKIMSSASQVVKPVTMELGGKSPIVVFEDVDLDKAAEWTAFGCFWTNGQICSATSRLIVHEKIVVAFLDRLVKWVKNIKICDPFEEGCRLGPVISQGQYCFRREVTNAVEKEVTVCEKELVGRSMMQDNGASSQKKPKDIDLWRNAGKEAGERRKDRDFGEGERPEKRTRCDGKDNADVHIICVVEKEKSVCLVPTDSSQVANLEARLRHCALVADRCRSIVYKVGECMQELLKMWKEYESYQGDKTKESSSQGI